MNGGNIRRRRRLFYPMQAFSPQIVRRPNRRFTLPDGGRGALYNASGNGSKQTDAVNPIELGRRQDIRGYFRAEFRRFYLISLSKRRH